MKLDELVNIVQIKEFLQGTLLNAKMTCLSEKPTGGDWLSSSTCSEGAMKERIGIMPSIKSIGIFGQVAPKIFRLDTMVSADQPSFRI